MPHARSAPSSMPPLGIEAMRMGAGAGYCPPQRLPRPDGALSDGAHDMHSALDGR